MDARTPTDVNISVWASVSVRLYTKNIEAKVQKRGVCQDKTAAASCMREKLPVASLQKAAGQPRYRPIRYVEAECRKLA